MIASSRDDTPVATIRPIASGEIAGVDDLVDFTGGQPAAEARRRRRWKIVAPLAARRGRLVAGYYAVTLVQVYRTGRSDQARPVDAIVVMGAAQYDGRPSPQLAARLDHVVDVVRARASPRWSSSPAASSPAIASPRPRRRRSTSSIAACRRRRSCMESTGRTTVRVDGRRRRAARRPRARHRARRHRPVPRAASRLIAEDVGLTAYVSPTPTLGRPRRQRRPPPPRRGRRRRPRPDHRLRPHLTPAVHQPMGVTDRPSSTPIGRRGDRFSVAPMGSGVTGNTADSGSVIRGSIPLSPAQRSAALVAWRTARRPGARQLGPFV